LIACSPCRANKAVC